MRRSLLITCLLVTACNSDPQDPTPDSGTNSASDAAPADTGATDAATADAGPTDTGATDAQPTDAGTGLPTTCEGACRTLDLAIDLSEAQGSFQRAYYGLTSPAQSNSGSWAVHIEATSGGADGCPTENSPSPDWTLVVSGLALPLSPEPVMDGISVSFLDFSGQFLSPAPITRSTARSVQVLAADLCTDCVGMTAPAHPTGLVSLSLEATFAEGTIRGQVFATHCDSLDLP